MSAIQQAYEQTSYPHYVHPLTDPARLAAIGRILGLPVALPNAARVLDIGCGSGTNLLAMAERMPGSHFLGIDFVAAEIEAAQSLAADAELKNVRFEQADLLDWQSHGAKFDYIIAYGLFSWVPDEVKDRLLQLCRDCLAPNGIACISYMTYPGCKQPEAIRDLLRLHTASSMTLEAKVDAAHQTLDFLDRAYDRLPHLPHSTYLHEQVRQIRRKEPHFLLLDDLGVERDPCYLMQFVNWAAEHGLRYVGESEFHTMFPENLPPDTARELAALDLDRLETEQLLDFVANRSFRCTLLAHAETAPSAVLRANALDELCAKPVLLPTGLPGLDPAEGSFRTTTGSHVTLRTEPLVAFSRALAARPHAFTPLPRVLSAAQQLARRTFSAAEVDRLREDLLSLFARRQLELSALAYSPPTCTPARPRLTPLNRAAARRRSMVITATHRASRLSAREQAFCALLDGTHRREDLAYRAAEDTAGESLEPFFDALQNAGCLAPD
jgi:SAM-dependent methyltransferase